MRFLTTLNEIEEDFVKKVVKSQKAYLDDLAAKLASGRTLTPKTLEWKIKTAKERLGMLRRDLKVFYSDAFDKTFDRFLKMGAEQIGMDKINFEAVPYGQFKTLKDAGLEYMINYSDDMYKKVKSQLYVSLMNGESYTDAWLRIKPFGNERARPKVMIRDQMSRVAQRAIEASYKASGKPQDFMYYWTGPDDARTTKECKERKRGNPYTYEQMKGMDYHPHIQCRHRWTAKPIDKPVEVKKEKPAEKDAIINDPLKELSREKVYMSNQTRSLKTSDVKLVYDGIEEMDNDSKRIAAKYWDDLKNVVRFEKDSKGKKVQAFYSREYKAVVLDGKKVNKETFKHEFGHFVDNQIATEKLGLGDKMYSELDNPLGNKIREYAKKYKGDRKLIDKVCNDLGMDRIGKKNTKHLSDIINAMTQEYHGYKMTDEVIKKVVNGVEKTYRTIKNVAGYGHPLDYWKKSGMIEAEVFAELWTIKNYKSKAALERSKKIIDKYFPELWELFEKTLAEVL